MDTVASRASQDSAPARQSGRPPGLSDTLATELRELIALLKRPPKDDKSKDSWDKFAAISTFVSSVVIAVIGLYFTQAYNRAESARRASHETRQIQINELDIVVKFMPYLVSDDEETKRTAITAIKRLAGVQLAAVMAELHPSVGTAQGLETVAQAATTSAEDRVVAAAAANRIYDRLPSLRVLWATDRAPDPAKTPPFGSGRGPLAFGAASVSIPESHRLGHVEQPSLLRFEFRPDPDKHIVLRSLSAVEEAAFIAELATSVTSSPRPDILIYVHGYNTTFETALLNHAQLAHDVARDLTAVMFSWPSRGEVSGYVQDMEGLAYAVPHLTSLLSRCLEIEAVRRVHVLARDQGCALALDALMALSRDGSSRLRVGNVILVTPDLDRQRFALSARAIAPVVERTTVYVSREYAPLRAAAALTGSPRAGESAEAIAGMGVDVVEVPARQGTVAPVRPSESVLADIYHLLTSNLPPSQRHGLRRVETAGGGHWVLE